MGINTCNAALEDWKQYLSEGSTAGHPLEVVSATVMVRAIQFGTRNLLNKPVKKPFMPSVHSHGHLRLKPVSTEVAFANEDAHQKTLIEVIHGMRLSATCFTVKFPVKHLDSSGTLLCS
jgi:hypothetical protein